MPELLRDISLPHTCSPRSQRGIAPPSCRSRPSHALGSSIDDSGASTASHWAHRMSERFFHQPQMLCSRMLDRMATALRASKPICRNTLPFGQPCKRPRTRAERRAEPGKLRSVTGQMARHAKYRRKGLASALRLYVGLTGCFAFGLCALPQPMQSCNPVIAYMPSSLSVIAYGPSSGLPPPADVAIPKPIATANSLA